MSNLQNESYIEQQYELQREWMEEDLTRILKKTQHHPGLGFEAIADIIKETLKEDTEFLIKELQKK